MKFRNNWSQKRNWNNWNWNAPTHQATLKAFQRFNVSPQKKVFHPLAISQFWGLSNASWDVKGHKSSIIYHKWRWSTDHTKHTDSVPFAKFIALQAYGQWRRVSRPHPHPRCRGWPFRTHSFVDRLLTNTQVMAKHRLASLESRRLWDCETVRPYH